jgi:hypothetical protein
LTVPLQSTTKALVEIGIYAKTSSTTDPTKASMRQNLDHRPTYKRIDKILKYIALGNYAPCIWPQIPTKQHI